MSTLARALALIEDGRPLGQYFAGPTWAVHKAVLKAGAGLPLSPDERALFAEVAGNRNPPTRQVRELWIKAGRRAGKDSLASAIIVAAALGDYSGQVRPGETPLVACIACDREQAAVVFNYVRGYFEQVPALADLMESEPTKDSIALKNGNAISVFPNSFRSVRGRTLVCCVFDEVALYRDERSSNPDTELYNAIVPSTVTVPDAVIVGISSPHRAAGLLYQKWRDHYGVDGNDVLIVGGASRTFNPSLPEAFIAEQLERDPAAGRAEWLGEFRNDLSGFLDPEWIERAAVLETGEMTPPKGAKVVAALDPSSGRKDAMTAAVAWQEGNRVVVGALRGRRAPFEPSSVVDEFAGMFKRYGVRRVRSDRYAIGFVTSSFAEKGITVVMSDKSTSDTMLEAEGLFAQGAIDIPRHEVLLRELRNLERRTRAGARDIVQHPTGGHDDFAVVVCRAAYEARRVAMRPKTVIPPAIALPSAPSRGHPTFEDTGRRNIYIF